MAHVALSSVCALTERFCVPRPVCEAPSRLSAESPTRRLAEWFQRSPERSCEVLIDRVSGLPPYAVCSVHVGWLGAPKTQLEDSLACPSGCCAVRQRVTLSMLGHRQLEISVASRRPAFLGSCILSVLDPEDARAREHALLGAQSGARIRMKVKASSARSASPEGLRRALAARDAERGQALALREALRRAEARAAPRELGALEAEVAGISAELRALEASLAPKAASSEERRPSPLRAPSPAKGPSLAKVPSGEAPQVEGPSGEAPQGARSCGGENCRAALQTRESEALRLRLRSEVLEAERRALAEARRRLASQLQSLEANFAQLRQRLFAYAAPEGEAERPRCGGLEALVRLLAAHYGSPESAFLRIDLHRAGRLGPEDLGTGLLLGAGVEYQALTGLSVSAIFRCLDRGSGAVAASDLAACLPDIWREHGRAPSSEGKLRALPWAALGGPERAFEGAAERAPCGPGPELSDMLGPGICLEHSKGWATLRAEVNFEPRHFGSLRQDAPTAAFLDATAARQTICNVAAVLRRCGGPAEVVHLMRPGESGAFNEAHQSWLRALALSRAELVKRELLRCGLRSAGVEPSSGAEDTAFRVELPEVPMRLGLSWTAFEGLVCQRMRAMPPQEARRLFEALAARADLEGGAPHGGSASCLPLEVWASATADPNLPPR